MEKHQILKSILEDSIKTGKLSYDEFKHLFPTPSKVQRQRTKPLKTLEERKAKQKEWYENNKIEILAKAKQRNLVKREELKRLKELTSEIEVKLREASSPPNKV